MHDVIPLPMLTSQTVVDIVGRPLSVGQIVACSGSTAGQQLGVIQCLHPQRVTVLVPGRTVGQWERTAPIWPRFVVGVEVGMNPADVQRIQNETQKELDFTEPVDQQCTKRYIVCTLVDASSNVYNDGAMVAVLEIYGSTAPDWEEARAHFESTLIRPGNYKVKDMLNIAGQRHRAYSSWAAKHKTANKLWVSEHDLNLSSFLHPKKRLVSANIHHYINKIMPVAEFNMLVTGDLQVLF